MSKIALFSTIILTLSLFSNAGAQCSESYGKSMTSYSYGGEFGAYGIADEATFCQDGVKYAEAKALEIEKMSPGPNAMKIRETHYDKYGSIKYEGYVWIRFGFGGSVLKEEAISGNKKYAFFTSWPSN